MHMKSLYVLYMSDEFFIHIIWNYNKLNFVTIWYRCIFMQSLDLHEKKKES